MRFFFSSCIVSNTECIAPIILNYEKCNNKIKKYTKNRLSAVSKLFLYVFKYLNTVSENVHIFRIVLRVDEH